MEYLFVAIGGTLGSLSRFFISSRISERYSGAYPLGTFIINLAGAFLLGVITAIPVTFSIYAFAAIGFLGSFTTFSTFMVESFSLFQSGEKKNAILYLIISMMAGIASYMGGYYLIIAA
jgi:CrcB protein